MNELDEMIPFLSPDEDQGRQQTRGHDLPPPNGKGTRSKAPRIASAQECRQALSSLPAMLITGLISASQANTLTRIYQALLRDYERGHAAPQGTVPPGLDLGAILGNNPELGELLEPILSREQIEKLMQQKPQHE